MINRIIPLLVIINLFNQNPITARDAEPTEIYCTTIDSERTNRPLLDSYERNQVNYYVNIYNWYSPSRADNFATTNLEWQGNINDERSPDYRLFRIEGKIFSPDHPRQAGTVPVYSWYSPSRGDNYMTSDPNWRGTFGDTKNPDYKFVRIEGYIYDPNTAPPQGAIPLYSWYDPIRGDNFVTTNRVWAGAKGVRDKSPNYRYVRREGYVIPYNPNPARTHVPVYFHFEYDHMDILTGLPAYGSNTAQKTMIDIDEALKDMNQKLSQARGMDPRRINFVRAGVHYLATPLGIRDCNLLGSRIAAAKLYGAINVLITPECGGVTTSPNTVRATSESLAHELGHALGLYHIFEDNTVVGSAESLFRDLDPASESSCYRLGDRVCDTPPDYGYAAADGSTTFVECGTAVPLPCEQFGPPCDVQDPIVDGRGICRPSGPLGLRKYDPVRLGLQIGTSNNIMAYHSQDEFTYEQFARLHNYALWRQQRGSEVPNDEKEVFKEFIFGPPSTEIWSSSPGFEHKLLNVKSWGQIALYNDPAIGILHWRGNITPSLGHQLLNFRIEILGTGMASGGTKVTITFPSGRRLSISGSNLLRENGRIILDEIFGEDLSEIRGDRMWGNWLINIENIEDFTPNQVFLSVLGY